MRPSDGAELGDGVGESKEQRLAAGGADAMRRQTTESFAVPPPPPLPIEEETARALASAKSKLERGIISPAEYAHICKIVQGLHDRDATVLAAGKARAARDAEARDPPLAPAAPPAPPPPPRDSPRPRASAAAFGFAPPHA